MTFGITDLTTFILGTIFIVLLPGPNSLYVMNVASRQGVKAGYAAAGGIFLGDTVLMTLSASGAATVLHTTPALFILLKYAGAAYLIWLGAGLLVDARRQWRPDVAVSAPAIASDPSRPFHTALLISLLNPKAILFFVSFFIQFVSPEYAYPALSFVVLGLIVQCASALYLSGVIIGGSRMAALLRRRRRLAASASGSVGGAFIGFGLTLAYAALN